MEDPDEQPTVAMPVDGDPLAQDSTVRIIHDRLELGTDVGGYVLDGELGHGGMGVVYAATHPVIGKRAAIKVLKPELSQNHDAVERFVLEARAVNQIGHPNIVDIFAFGELPDGRSYYVMDLLAGESLRARLKRGALHVAEAAAVIDETASALIAAHAKGIVHRDLKPDNVFVVTVPGRWPEVKLLDWGLAKLAPAAGGKERTLAGSVLGTPVYMSPEQARASTSVDHRTDIYALGVMSYELVTGAVPFKKGTSLDTLVAHAEDPVPPVLAKVPSLPVELAQLIEAMLAKRPEDRPTLAAVRAVLKRLKGTKIPTMTAAGLSQMSEQLAPMFEQPDPSLSPQTIRELGISQQLTSVQAAPRVTVPALSTRPGFAAPRGSAPLGPQASSLPAPSQPAPSQPAPSLPVAAPVPARTRTMSWLVIAIAAVIALAIGVVIAMIV